MSSIGSASVNYNTINFKSNIGSFKLMGTDIPAKGVLEVEFTGTLLVSGLVSGSAIPSTGLVREYNSAKYKKQVYHGTGKLILNGSFAAVQFFGRNVSGKFTGLGIFRFYGEFDKNLDTGDYWYDGGDHNFWGTGGAQVTVPGYAPRIGATGPPEPKVKMKTKSN
jgi:hypothetical protein